MTTTPAALSELKPCPFCGEPDRFYFEDGAVVCGGCGASSPIVDTDEQAIAAWNLRSHPNEGMAGPTIRFDNAYLHKLQTELESRGWQPDPRGEPDCADEASAAAAEIVDAVLKFRALPAAVAPGERENLCSDCPPVGYPTDETRCTECPRRSAPQNRGSNLNKATCEACDGKGFTELEGDFQYRTSEHFPKCQACKGTGAAPIEQSRGEEGHEPFERDDKELAGALFGVRVWIDYDDVDREAADKAARLIEAASLSAPSLEDAQIQAMLPLHNLSSAPWRVVEGRENVGKGWPVASMGTDHNGVDWYIETHGVLASEAFSDPKADAIAIVKWRNAVAAIDAARGTK